MQTFVETKTRKEAQKKIGHHVSKMVKADGGYIGFEHMTDYEIWKKAK